MKRLALSAAIPLLILIGGCTSSKKAVAPDLPGISVLPSSTAAPASTATTVTAATTVASATPAPSTATVAVTPPPVANAMTQISITVGKDDSPTRVEKVKLNATVQISFLNPTSDDEFHLHDYDLEQKTKAGEQSVLSFIADKPGSFALESHLTDAVLLTLVVE